MQRRVGVYFRGAHLVDNHFEQGRHVVGQLVGFRAGVAVQGGGVDNGEVQLLVSSAEAIKQIKDLIDNPVRASAGAVDLVDHDDRLQTAFEGLLGDKAGLRHGAVHRIDQQQYAVDHRQHALYLTAEISVPGGVHDIDAVAVPVDGGVFGENGNTALALLVVGVHDALGTFAAAIQGSGLAEEFINQGGFAVVNVGDNRDIA